jgi:tRNA(fMet)-specific endonuclease VapC
MPVLSYDLRAAHWHAEQRAQRLAAGRPTAFADTQSAAIAVTNGLTLVTANGRDFRSFEGLRIEDWRSG